LHSYSLVQADLDALKATNEKLAADKSSLEQQLALSKSAVPIASQAQGLREQLRQTQAQVAALAEENVRLKNQLVASNGPRTAPGRPGAPAATTITAAAANPAATVRNPPAAAAPASRTHTIVAGDTLIRISLNYYGTPNRWSDILAANTDVLRDEKSLVIGRVLRIP
jgi:nucleoid-associated protein YgaU